MATAINGIQAVLFVGNIIFTVLSSAWPLLLNTARISIIFVLHTHFLTKPVRFQIRQLFFYVGGRSLPWGNPIPNKTHTHTHTQNSRSHYTLVEAVSLFVTFCYQCKMATFDFWHFDSPSLKPLCFFWGCSSSTSTSRLCLSRDKKETTSEDTPRTLSKNLPRSVQSSLFSWKVSGTTIIRFPTNYLPTSV